VAEHSVDLVHIHFMVMAQYVGAIPENVPTVLTDYDCSHFLRGRSYLKESSLSAGRGGVPEWQKTRGYAKKFYPRFGAVLLMSRHDAEVLEQVIPDFSPKIIPLGIDAREMDFRIAKSSAAREPTSLVFVGNFSHYPNEDAAIYFCRQILPRIRRRVPTVKAYFVGDKPTPAMRAMASDDIVITGAVRDVAPYLKVGSVFVAPVRLGGGMKGKILEAFAAGIPVVTTPCVAKEFETTGSSSGLVVAKTEEEFADSVITLLFDRGLRQGMIRQGHALARGKYDIREMTKAYERLYNELLKRKSHTSSPD
jgi:glycosyltransferase involved in cell wall biosynthesis